MKSLSERCRDVFGHSRRLPSEGPNEDQLQNVLHRLREIFPEEELQPMEQQELQRQVERVWPIARHVDKP